jgi:glycosyltransferase involved in cell wall biosynthesis
MRIAFINTRADAVGGSQVHVRDLAAEMIKRGHEACVFIGGTGPVSEFLSAAGVPWKPIQSMRRNVNFCRDLRALKELKQALAEYNPDLISTHTSKAGMLGRLASVDLGIPSIFTAHGWSFADGINSIVRAGRIGLEKIAARWCERIITVSEADRELGLRFHVCPADQIMTIHNGMPELQQPLRADPSRSPVRIVMVARFEQQKDHETLLTALGGLKHLPWELELIGGGPNEDKVKSIAGSLGIAERVQFPGAVTDVSDRLARAQIFALISNWEGLPRSIIEAMRAGLPVVASDVGGTRELIEQGRTGYLIARGDAAALRRTLDQLISNSALRTSMGQAGRARYENHFTFDRMLDKTFRVYEEVIRSTPNRFRDRRSDRPRVVHVVESFAAGTAAVVTELARSMPEYQHVIIHGSRDNAARPKQELLGASTQLIPWRRAGRELSLFRDCRALLELVNLLGQQPRIDLLHGHSAKGGAHARIAAMLLGISRRTLYTTHGSPVLRLDVSALSKAFFVATEWVLSKLSSTVVACSTSELAALNSYGIHGQVIANGTASGESASPISTNKSELHVGTVGRIVAQKDPGFMSQIATLAASDPRIHLTWIGAGDLESELDPRVNRTGWLAERQVAEQIAGLDIYLSTSRWEGLSLSVLSAMFMGKPLVLRRCVGNVDAVIDGENGFLFDSPATAFEQLRALAGNPQLRMRMGQRSREIALKQFTSQRMVQQYRELYQQLARPAVEKQLVAAKTLPSPRRLRVLMVLEASAGGAGRHVLDLAEGLILEGCQVHLLYSEGRIDRMFSERVRSIPGLQTARLDLSRHVSLGDFSGLVETRRYIQAHGPFDIIHGHSAKGGAVARLSALGSKAAVFYTPHGFQLMDPGLSGLNRVCYAAIEFSLSFTRGKTIVVSPEERQAIQRLGMPADRIALVCNGIKPDVQNASRQSARRELNLSEDAIVIGFVGRLVKLKAVDVLLRAFAVTAARVSQARLVIVGSGPLRESLETLATDLGVGDRVIWLGERNGRDFIRGFDIFALASRKEGLPYVILEAMAAGLPIVATETCSVSVLLKSDETGLVVPRDNVEQLADALSRLGSDEMLRSRLGHAARVHSARFSVTNMVRETLAVYHQALGEESPKSLKRSEPTPVPRRVAA